MSAQIGKVNRVCKIIKKFAIRNRTVYINAITSFGAVHQFKRYVLVLYHHYDWEERN